MNIKKLLLYIGVMVAPFVGWAQPNFSYYHHTLCDFVPKNITLDGKDVALQGKFNGDIPTPKQVLGYELGERYVEWADVVQYMEALAAKSDRVSLVELGRSNEARRFIKLVITSPQNHSSLDKIKADHLKLVDVAHSAEVDTKQMPLIANVICSMHGNEVSGVNASIAIAYFFAASEDEAVVKMLDDMVLLLIPGINPDGINRYSTWCNTALGTLKIEDPNTYEHGNPWPGMRTNHYYADTNRDLLMCQHQEGRIAVKQYLDWHPNLVLDAHEMRSKNARFFHSPGHPLRLHQYVTAENQALTGEIGAYIEKALTPLGAHPYSGTQFDDYYIGKGACYGDIQGSVCLLFEQAAARGYIRQFDNETITLPQTIRHQSEAVISALCAGYDIREKLLNYQRDFYVKSAAKAEQSEVQGYIFHARGDKAKAYRLLENLLIHNIDIYHLAKDVKVGKEKFDATESFIIPLNQRYFYKVKAIWETLAADSFQDNTFYDISTWTFPLAYDVAHAELKSVDGLIGEPAALVFPQGNIIGGVSDKGYIIDARALYSHNLLNALMTKGVEVKVATEPFKAAKQKLSCGCGVVEVANQPISAEEIYKILDNAAKENGVDVYAIEGKLNLEKLALQSLEQPKVAMLADNGINATAMGEIWMLLEKHYGIAPARLSFNVLGKKSLAKYNVLVVADGALPRKHKAHTAIRKWIEAGGTLITTGNGYKMAARAKLPAIKQLPKPEGKGPEAKIAGAIFDATIDTSSPLGYGYTTSRLPLFRMGVATYDEAATEGVIVPLRYASKPHLSGYASQANIERIASTPAVMVVKCGDGRIIHFADNPTFRSYWFGASKLLMNAIYFGQLY